MKTGETQATLAHIPAARVLPLAAMPRIARQQRMVSPTTVSQ